MSAESCFADLTPPLKLVPDNPILLANLRHLFAGGKKLGFHLSLVAIFYFSVTFASVGAVSFHFVLGEWTEPNLRPLSDSLWTGPFDKA